jgi:hypothetical protein
MTLDFAVKEKVDKLNFTKYKTSAHQKVLSRIK